MIAALLGLLAAGVASADQQDDSLARLKIEKTVQGFERRLGAMRAGRSGADRPDPALVADVEIFIKAARWGLRYDSEGRPTDATLIERALSRCIERFPELGQEQPSWASNIQTERADASIMIGAQPKSGRHARATQNRHDG